MYISKRQHSKRLTILSLLSILLVLITGYGFTFAWFFSRDYSSTTARLGGAVLVRASDNVGEVTHNFISYNITMNNLLPGSLLSPNINATLLQSSTAAVMRAKIVVTATEYSHYYIKQDIENFFMNSLETHINSSWDLYSDGWFYFLGSATTTNVGVMNTTAMEVFSTNPDAVPTFGTSLALYDAPTNREIVDDQTIVASVYAGAGNVTLPFLNQSFRIPGTFGNDFASVKVSFSFYIESLQDYLVDEDTEENVLTTLENVKNIMDSISQV